MNTLCKGRIALSLALAWMAGPIAPAASKPNVILIVTDDQGYGDLSCHGNPVLKTPHLDRLHRESVRFTDFHVAPMCSPTRGQLMTGIDAMRNGCTAVCQGRSMMRSDLPTMANFFEDSGYTTGHFGKWHLGASYPHRPQDRGFQETIHHRAWGITSLADYWMNTYFDPVLEHNGVDKKFEGYCTDIFFNESMKWVEKCQAEKKPFFLYLATNTPHVPNVCEEKYSKPYRGTHEGKPMPDTFYGMIANFDENVGRLEAFLKARGLRENTLLIFMSDNGTQSSGAKAIYNAGMRDKKTSVFEGGHRVPCFIRWPQGKLHHGKDIHTLTQVQDLLPTLIELCGLAGKGSAFDGMSLAGLLKGRVSGLPDRKLVVQYRVSGESWNPAVVLWNKWRLVGPGKLYHVGRDPGQARNVADQHPEVAQAMAAHYDAWHGEAKPLFERPRWITLGSAAANPMILYAQDWTGGYCDNRGGLTRATAQGYWNVIVERAGTYALELRRWPKESDKTLAEGLKGPQDTGSSARPVAAANVQIAGANHTLDIGAEDTHAAFYVKLPAGKSQLATTLLDGEDRALCSAIYVYLKHLPASDHPLTPSSTRKAKGTAPSKPARKKPVKPGPPAKAVAMALLPGDILLADFEGTDYGDWKSTGSAFGAGPSGPENRVANLQGKRLVDTFLLHKSDQPTGTLTSPLFTLERKYLNLLVGGGNTPGLTCVNLLVDGKPVRTATGSATKDAQNRKIMHWVSWELSDLRGRKARLEIVDRASGGWGHIMADQVFMADRSVR
jgi:arylsulfatase A-like enzyme